MTYGRGLKFTRISENGRIPSLLVQVRPSYRPGPDILYTEQAPAPSTLVCLKCLRQVSRL